MTLSCQIVLINHLIDELIRLGAQAAIAGLPSTLAWDKRQHLMPALVPIQPTIKRGRVDTNLFGARLYAASWQNRVTQ
ncbi:hypothetical protein D3C80_1077000 [compost metagenome]